MPRITKPAVFDKGTFNYALAKSLGVQNLFLFDQASGQIVDFMNPQLVAAALTSGMTPAIDTAGRVIKTNGSSGAQNIALPAPMQSPSPAFGNNIVLMGRIKATAVQSGSPGAAFGMYSSTGQIGFGIGFDNGSPPNVGFAQLAGNGANVICTSPSALNTWVTVAVQTQLASGNSSGNYAWINGAPAVTSQGGTGLGGAQSTLSELAFGAQHRSSGFLRWFNGLTEWAAVIVVPQTPMPDDWHWQLYASDFPYNLFSVEPDFAAATGGVHSYTYTPTGGLILTGSAPLLRATIKTPSGGLIVSGSASQLRGKIQPTPVGGIVFAGTSTQLRGMSIAPSGGITFAGTSSVIKSAICAITGGLLFGGTSPMTTVNSRVVTPSGGLSLGGAAAFVRTVSRAVSGGIVFGGTSAYQSGAAFVSTMVDWLGQMRRRGRR